MWYDRYTFSVYCIWLKNLTIYIWTGLCCNTIKRSISITIFIHAFFYSLLYENSFCAFSFELFFAESARNFLLIPSFEEYWIFMRKFWIVLLIIEDSKEGFKCSLCIIIYCARRGREYTRDTRAWIAKFLIKEGGVRLALS